MLRYKTEIRAGLVALYDIRPGNGSGPFLQPRSPHGAQLIFTSQSTTCLTITGDLSVDTLPLLLLLWWCLHQDVTKYALPAWPISP